MNSRSTIKINYRTKTQSFSQTFYSLAGSFNTRKTKKLKGLLYIDSYFSSKQHKKSAQVMLLSNTLKNNKQAGFAEKKASHHLLSDKMLLHLPS